MYPEATLMSNGKDARAERFGNGKTERLAQLICEAARAAHRHAARGRLRDRAWKPQSCSRKSARVSLASTSRRASTLKPPLRCSCKRAMREGSTLPTAASTTCTPTTRSSTFRSTAWLSTKCAACFAADGGYCIGTPNRARLIGYVGSSNTLLSEKIAWNAADWKARLKGRFRNEFGAHAGFTSVELSSELRRVFSTATDVSDDYYDAVYSRHSGKLAVLRKAGIHGFVYPSVYFVGRR